MLPEILASRFAILRPLTRRCGMGCIPGHPVTGERSTVELQARPLSGISYVGVRTLIVGVHILVLFDQASAVVDHTPVV